MDPPFTFSWQHHVSFISNNGNLYDITLFDNAFDGSLQQNTSAVSSGKWIQMDEVAMTAHLVHSYVNPNGILVASQGSVQALPSGNVMVGWGAMPYFSEFDINGDLLYHAHFGLPRQNAMQSFRSYKFPWVSQPTDSPVILPYAQNCSGETYAYVSWNGATEVDSWRFHIGNSNQSAASFRVVPDASKTGFETRVDLGPFVQYAFVEALDSTGTVIGTSATNATFVPAPQFAANCTQMACNVGFTYLPQNAATCNSTLDQSKVFQIAPAAPAVYFDIDETYEGVPMPPSDDDTSDFTGPPS